MNAGRVSVRVNETQNAIGTENASTIATWIVKQMVTGTDGREAGHGHDHDPALVNGVAALLDGAARETANDCAGSQVI